MTVCSRIPIVVVLIAVLLGAGCSGGDTTPVAAEMDEAAFRTGQQRLREGRAPEALTWFLKVIEKRGLQNAPESHLEAGRIYLQHIKHPIYAYYHFSKYLELKPNSQEAPLVRQKVEEAIREFGATLPLRPEENQVRYESAERLDKLERENAELRAENATLRGARALPPPRSGRMITAPDNSHPAPIAPDDASPITAAPPPRPIPPAPSRAAPVPIAKAPTQAAPMTKTPAPTTAPKGRTHTVAQGEGLFAIARRYEPVNTTRKVQEIVEANPDVLPAGVGTPLKPGMVLRIP